MSETIIIEKARAEIRGVGWDRLRPVNGTTVDVIFYAAFDPQDDAVLDEMVATHLREGKKIKLDHSG